MLFVNAEGFYSGGSELSLEGTWIKMDDADLKTSLGGQSPRQRDQLPLGPAVTEVTNEKSEAAWGRGGHESEL